VLDEYGALDATELAEINAEAVRLCDLLADEAGYREAIAETVTAMKVTLQLPMSEVRV
jgi:hypothetical protein